jgi:type IV secretory pathway VirB4 component
MKARRSNRAVGRPVQMDTLRPFWLLPPFDQHGSHMLIFGATRSGKSVLSGSLFRNTVRRDGRGS